VCGSHTRACGNHFLRVEITLVRVEIILVCFEITVVRVVIAELIFLLLFWGKEVTTPINEFSATLFYYTVALNFFK
jgi:hypothetical protein